MEPALPFPVDAGRLGDEAPVDLGALDAIEADLAAVERAMARLADGEYGRCERCGTPIDPAALAAAPTTARCAEHAAEAPVATGLDATTTTTSAVDAR